MTFTADSPNKVYISNIFSGQFNTTGQYLASTGTANGTPASDAFTSLTISFASPVAAFGFSYGASDKPWTLTAFNSANVALGSASFIDAVPGSDNNWNDGTFLGFASDSADIAYAKLTLGGSTRDYFMIDNLKYTSSLAAAVPEPSAPAMIAAGLAVLGFIARRRAPKQSA